MRDAAIRRKDTLLSDPHVGRAAENLDGGIAERARGERRMGALAEEGRRARARQERRAIAAGEVHVWRLELDVEGSVLDALTALLSDGERDRAARFRFSSDAERYVAGRGQLREVLGAYLGRDPAAVRFTYGRYGKPALARSVDRPALCFNLAHADGMGLLAVTVGRAVGIDLEPRRPGFSGAEVAEQFFAPGEVARLRMLPEADRDSAFVRGWTRKEAYVKAHGAGLTMPLDAFEVPLTPEPPVGLVWSRCPGETLRWSLIDLSAVVPGFTAALAVEGGDVEVRCRWWRMGDADA